MDESLLNKCVFFLFADYNKIIGSKIFTFPGRTDEMTIITKAQDDKFSESFAKYNTIMDSKLLTGKT